MRSARADEPLRLAAVLEAPDAGVLEELADDRADADPLRQPGTPGTSVHGAADDEVDVDAGRRRPVQRLDARPIEQRVHLQHDAAAGRPAACSDLALDELEEALAQPGRGDEQPPERRAAATGR